MVCGSCFLVNKQTTAGITSTLAFIREPEVAAVVQKCSWWWAKCCPKHVEQRLINKIFYNWVCIWLVVLFKKKIQVHFYVTSYLRGKWIIVAVLSKKLQERLRTSFVVSLSFRLSVRLRAWNSPTAATRRNLVTYRISDFCEKPVDMWSAPFLDKTQQNSWLLKMGIIGFPETSVTNHQSARPNIPEERISHVITPWRTPQLLHLSKSRHFG
jgi:hypothetical protein